MSNFNEQYRELIREHTISEAITDTISKSVMHQIVMHMILMMLGRESNFYKEGDIDLNLKRPIDYIIYSFLLLNSTKIQDFRKRFPNDKYDVITNDDFKLNNLAKLVSKIICNSSIPVLGNLKPNFKNNTAVQKAIDSISVKFEQEAKANGVRFTWDKFKDKNIIYKATQQQKNMLEEFLRVSCDNINAKHGKSKISIDIVDNNGFNVKAEFIENIGTTNNNQFNVYEKLLSDLSNINTIKLLATYTIYVITNNIYNIDEQKLDKLFETFNSSYKKTGVEQRDLINWYNYLAKNFKLVQVIPNSDIIKNLSPNVSQIINNNYSKIDLSKFIPLHIEYLKNYLRTNDHLKDTLNWYVYLATNINKVI